MNELNGKIIDTQVEGNLSLVHIGTHSEMITAIVLETPRTAAYLETGRSVRVLFKETEVIIAKEIGTISLRNRLPCTIKKVESGKLLSRLVLAYHEYELVSIVTTGAVKDLQLEEGMAVVALIKTNEIMLAE